MEPTYVGANGKIDAIAAAWLLDEDYVFFLDDQITWDGRNHSFTGAQFNSGNMTEAPVFMANYEMLMHGVVDLMIALEQDEGLRVPREAIHPALYAAIREGDLTGITLFNLLACGHAIKIMQNQESSYQVLYDTRLSRGIPDFFTLLLRLVWDMRAYNGIEGPFQVVFMSARNFDADECLNDFEGAVPGAAQGQPLIEQVSEMPVTRFSF